MFRIFVNICQEPVKLSWTCGADNLSADHGSWLVILAITPNGIVDEAVI